MPAFQSTPFAKQLVRRQLAWRREHATPSHDDKRPSPMFNDWRDGLHPAYQDAIVELATTSNIKLHSHAAAVNSSMVFAFNLFAPFAADQDLTGWLPAACGVTRVNRVRFEWTPPGDLLAEVRGTVPSGREASTAIDVLVEGEREGGGKVAILIEVKLSEGGFTACGGRHSKANGRTDVCEDGDLFLADPASCYLTRPRSAARDRRYWTILEQRYGSVRAAIARDRAERACPFAGDANQIMRQHALAVALEQSGTYDEAWVGLVHHDDNPDVNELWRDTVAMFNPAARFFRNPASTLLSHGGRCGDAHWAEWMADRYAMESSS